MSFVVKKAIQDYAKKKNVQVSGDFYAALDKHIGRMLDSAVSRTSENKRKTLKPYDL
jgi:histone H3/H4